MKLVDGLSEEVPVAVKLLPAIDAPRPGTSLWQLANLLEQIQRATLEAKKLVEGRSTQDLTTRPKPESWSAAECFDHLAKTTDSFLPAILKLISGAPKLAGSRALATGTVASLLIRNLEPPYRLRYKVLKPLVPKETDFDAAWSAFEESQSRLLAAIGSSAGLAIDKVKLQCPVYAHVTYNGYGAFRMLAAHERRHLWQIQQILKAIDARGRLKTAV
jgi:hypothetical protein